MCTDVWEGVHSGSIFRSGVEGTRALPRSPSGDLRPLLCSVVEHGCRNPCFCALHLPPDRTLTPCSCQTCRDGKAWFPRQGTRWAPTHSLGSRAQSQQRPPVGQVWRWEHWRTYAGVCEVSRARAGSWSVHVGVWCAGRRSGQCPLGIGVGRTRPPPQVLGEGRVGPHQLLSRSCQQI